MKRFWKKKSKGAPQFKVQNRYYESVSERLGMAQVIIYLLLLAFVVLSLLRNTNLITYRNLYYFVKDFNASAEKVDVWNTDSVSYPTDEHQSFAIYRKGLAVAGNTSVTVFTATGRQTVSQSISYRTPTAVGSGKYLLVYDLGGTAYSLYNSYTQIYAGKTTYPISGGTVSENGTYAIVSASDTHNSVVSVYSSNFKEINTFSKGGYVMDVAIDSKGETIALVTSANTSGRFSTELLVCRAKSDQALATVTCSNSLALSCSFTASGVVGVLCTDGVYTYTERGALLNSYSFDGDTVAASCVGADGIAVCLKTLGRAERRTVVVLDGQGALLSRVMADEPVDALARYESTVFIQGASGVTALHAKTGERSFVACVTDQKTVLAVGLNEILLCSPQKAVYLNFKF